MMPTLRFLLLPGGPFRGWLLLALLALGLARPALAQRPDARPAPAPQRPAPALPLPTQQPGLERAPLQTTQLSENPPADTARVFSLRDLADLVFANHPLVKQAALLSAEARAQILQARGGFDPKLNADLPPQRICGHRLLQYLG